MIIKKFGDMLFLPVVAAMASADTAATREATTIVLKVPLADILLSPVGFVSVATILSSPGF